jgi:hypothetical protein
LARYFSVHSRGVYSEGHRVQLQQVAAGLPADTPTEIGDTARVLFPEGVSEQGNFYLLQPRVLDTQNPAQHRVARDAFGEVLVELVRRIEAPSAPSRFQSLFAFEDLDDARWFRQTFRGGQGSIYAIDRDEGFRGDFTLLASLQGTPLRATAYARRYWASQPHWVGTPRWESLLRLPVTIGPKIN